MSDRKRLETIVVLGLACLVVSAIWARPGFACIAAAILALGLFKTPSTWLAAGWLALAHILGTIVSAILLTLVFYLILTPIAAVARLAGRKAPSFGPAPADSAWTRREYSFAPKDFNRPF